jgi:cysteine synthase A
MIYENVTQLIGNTPLVRLSGLKKELGFSGEILMKLEQFNPGYSIKDRVAMSIIEDAEKRGILIKEGPKPSIIVESTSGNTGIGLAVVAATRGYKTVIFMPSDYSVERQKLLKYLGAKVVLTDAETGMTGAGKEAREYTEKLVESGENAVFTDQFFNPANPAAHAQTAREIISDTDGKFDAIVTSPGTTGTIMGLASALNSEFNIVAVEPDVSPYLTKGFSEHHKIEGIGPSFDAGFLDKSLINEYVSVTENEAIETTKLLAKTEGIMAGISTGCSLMGAIKYLSKPEHSGETVVTFAHDNSERYMSTELFN